MKGGISWPVQERCSDPVAKFFGEGSKLGWHYNWNKNYTCQILPETSPNLVIDGEFVPMLWRPDFIDNTDKLQDGYKLILGYNEPDSEHAQVASRVSPKDAVSWWRKVVQLRTANPDIKLASPGVASSFEWLGEFFSHLTPEEMPDYLAVHCYTTTFDDFKATVTRYHEAFKLPVLVTEYAMTSFMPHVHPPSNMQQVHDFMGKSTFRQRQTTHWMDEQDWIIKYCWFGAVRDKTYLYGVHPYNRLMDEQGNLTALGQQYRAGGHE